MSTSSPQAHLISVLAYQIWEQEGRPEGRALENWRQAEQQLEIEFRVGFTDAIPDEDEVPLAPSRADRVSGMATRSS